MATRTDRPNNGTYRRQLIAMFDDETADRIETEAAAPDSSKAAVIREYVALGMRRKDALERAKAKPVVTGGPTLDGPAD